MFCSFYISFICNCVIASMCFDINGNSNLIKNPFLGPKYFTNRFSCTNTKLNQVTIQFYAKIVARLLLKLGWDILPHIGRIATANPK